MGEVMEQKEWNKSMSIKFLKWRQANRYSGMISVPEVAHFAQEVILEAKEIYKEKKE